MGYIYKIYNDINDKLYIGQTNATIEERFLQHKKKINSVDRSTYPLYNAMKKYGINHFFIDIIEETDNLDEREKYWIKYYDTYNHGYNATWGGDGGVKYDYDYIAQCYQEKNISIRELAKELGINRATISRALKAKNIPILSRTESSKQVKSKSIGQYNKDTNELIKIFSCVEDAAKSLGKHHGHISSCANGSRKSAYGYIWKFIDEDK